MAELCQDQTQLDWFGLVRLRYDVLIWAGLFSAGLELFLSGGGGLQRLCSGLLQRICVGVLKNKANLSPTRGVNPYIYFLHISC